jgi:hypothetical protein
MEAFKRCHQGYESVCCVGSLGDPFSNTRGKRNVENLARSVEKEEKTERELLRRA